ncbi:MAG: hypothetical protein P9L94_16370 [Candidatus Hinthialibacter antarcticus]|nr:hypothetical protein [Candidatus Hinthialibacter antarcticus]
MIEPVSTNVTPPAVDEAAALYYAERILELSNLGFYQLAQQRFQTYESCLRSMLSAEVLNSLQERTAKPDDWSAQKEQNLMARMKDAVEFNEHKAVHDCAHEILLHHNHRADRCPTHHICDEVIETLAENNAHFIEPGEIDINTSINAEVEFVVEQRRTGGDGRNPQGNPGFYWTDALNRKFRGFIKQVENINVGDNLKLKVTNVPGLTINSREQSEQILYLEPRVSPGDIIEVKLSSLSHTRNSFTFRHHSYDGFLWFKRRGVNKEIFNERTLRPNERLYVKILYTTNEERRSSKGNITRLGVIKAIPFKRVEEQPSPAERLRIGAASAPN